MADGRELSVEEILAACRRLDGEGGAEADAPEPAPAPKAPAPAASEEKPAAAPSAGPKKDPAEMSVEDMLAAARGEKAATAKAAPSESASSESASSESAPSTKSESPAAASDKKSSEMSVAEMLAAARGEKSAPKASPKAKAAPKPKPAAAEKTSPKAPEKPKPGGPKDTASILAAARKGAKPGPVSKSAAPAKAPEKQKPAKPKLEAPPMPEKPAYAKSAPAARASADEQDRRNFFSWAFVALFGSAWAVGLTMLGLTHVLWLLGLARFMFPNILTEPPTKFKVGFPDTLAPGQVETKFKAQFGVWIVRYQFEGQAQIYALRSVCTHLGCTPNWLEADQKFKCPCHGSGFYKDGINFEGPAPRPLERYAIRVADDGQLEVDKSQMFNEEKGQWSDPASFVSV